MALIIKPASRAVCSPSAVGAASKQDLDGVALGHLN
jgi:hypothetical protein